MVECRCDVLNHLTGAMAVDYLSAHLDTVTGSDIGNRTFECRETGIRWTDQMWGRDGSPRLRRSLDR